ncbi:MAG: class II SORL domain-containing protein [Candidatus Brocadiia bacterium]
MTKVGDLYRSADFKTEKHVPVIELPTTIKPGEFFEVTVSVGKEIPHPNTSAHFIAWIGLAYKADGEPTPYDLGRAEFGAHGSSVKGADSIVMHTNPFAKFLIKVDKPGELIASSYCNIHGYWESGAKVTL